MPNLGIARLRTEKREGRSVVCEQYSQAPLQLHRQLYLEPGSAPVMYLKTPSSGLLQGDRHQIELAVGENSSLELRTQASTLAYPGSSSQSLMIRVEQGASLTFHPHLLILAAGSDLIQRVEVLLAKTASIDYQEEWCVGRIAMGELWQFHRFDYRIEIKREERLIFRESWRINPARDPLTNNVIAKDFTHFRTLFTFHPQTQTDAEYDSQAQRRNQPGNGQNSSVETQRQWIMSGPDGKITRTLINASNTSDALAYS